MGFKNFWSLKWILKWEGIKGLSLIFIIGVLEFPYLKQFNKLNWEKVIWLLQYKRKIGNVLNFILIGVYLNNFPIKIVIFEGR